MQAETLEELQEIWRENRLSGRQRSISDPDAIQRIRQKNLAARLLSMAAINERSSQADESAQGGDSSGLPPRSPERVFSLSDLSARSQLTNASRSYSLSLSDLSARLMPVGLLRTPGVLVFRWCRIPLPEQLLPHVFRSDPLNALAGTRAKEACALSIQTMGLGILEVT
jgi:hypothetical protein